VFSRMCFVIYNFAGPRERRGREKQQSANFLSLRFQTLNKQIKIIKLEKFYLTLKMLFEIGRNPIIKLK